jgi:phenylalanine-4-hydroxylase
VATHYKHGQPIPKVVYNDEETATWGAVWDKMEGLLDTYACNEYKAILPLMKEECGYSRDNIPQQEDISNFLRSRTGFAMRPVGGLLSSRDFLNALAFRVFFSTQYIRHHTKPLYTPEPDICHELLGHAPMFADPDFADFSQEIGLASLGASDDVVNKLATCYWFSVEFGLCRQQGDIKAYGAGLLSSFGELEYSCAPYRPAGGTDERPELREWEPEKAALQEFPITTYQPIYYVSEGLNGMKKKMLEYSEALEKPFHCRYQPLTQSIWVDRAIKRDQFEEKVVDELWDKSKYEGESQQV